MGRRDGDSVWQTSSARERDVEIEEREEVNEPDLESSGGVFSGFDDRGSRIVGIGQYGTRTRTGRRGLGVSSNQRTGSPMVIARQLWQGQMEMGRERI